VSARSDPNADANEYRYVHAHADGNPDLHANVDSHTYRNSDVYTNPELYPTSGCPHVHSHEHRHPNEHVHSHTDTYAHAHSDPHTDGDFDSHADGNLHPDTAHPPLYAAAERHERSRGEAANHVGH
jgi:hypothetical protein